MLTTKEFYRKWRKDNGIKLIGYNLNEAQIIAMMQDYRDYFQMTNK